jgi:putative transposase
VQLAFIRPGKPAQNAHVESFNRRLRNEPLDAHQFGSLANARGKIEAWRIDHHQQRLHGAHRAPDPDGIRHTG